MHHIDESFRIVYYPKKKTYYIHETRKFLVWYWYRVMTHSRFGIEVEFDEPRAFKSLEQAEKALLKYKLEIL